MKIVAISDTHGMDFFDIIPICDILLIAGDISPARMDHTFYLQKAWFESDFILQLIKAKNKAKYIVFIGGNHDTYLHEVNVSGNNNKIKNILPTNVHYLCDSLINIEGINIYGSPWCNLPVWGYKGPPVWNFALTEKDLRHTYNDIPIKTDILLTHGPAYGYCDRILDSNVVIVAKKRYGDDLKADHLGSVALRDRIALIPNIKYVVSGHIHSGDRTFPVYKNSLEHLGTRFVCASILDETYNFNKNQPPIIITYNENKE